MFYLHTIVLNFQIFMQAFRSESLEIFFIPGGVINFTWTLKRYLKQKSMSQCRRE